MPDQIVLFVVVLCVLCYKKVCHLYHNVNVLLEDLTLLCNQPLVLFAVHVSACAVELSSILSPDFVSYI